MLHSSLPSPKHSLIHLVTGCAVVIVGFFVSVPPAVCGSAEASLSTEAFGEALSLEETVPITEILADPEAFRGQKVRVEGQVREVCPKKGCWMDLVPPAVADGTAESLRIKVDDDVIVFPRDAAGSTAVAEGVVEVIDLDRERYISWLAHQAEERGEDFDPSGIGEGPFQWVQIKGAGARLSRR